MKKRIITTLLAAAMISSLAACAAPEEAPASSTGGGTTSTATTSTGGDTESTGGGDTENELYEFRMIAKVNEMDEGSYAYIAGIEEALNVKIDLQIPPATSYDEQIQLMIVGGEYADVSLIQSHINKTYVDAVRDGVFINMADYIPEDGNIMKYSYPISFDTLDIMQDGGIYGIPRTSIARQDGFTIRTDWLETLGIEVDLGGYIGIEQLEEILIAFAKDDPDGNGIDDTYGLSAYADANGNITPQFANAFGVSGWQLQDDGTYMNLMYSREHDNYKEALAWANEMWKAGAIDPDWPTLKASDVAQERYKQGITGVKADFAGWMPDLETGMQEFNPEAELGYVIGILDDEGEFNSAGSFSIGFWGLHAISSTAEQPERIVEVFEYALSDEYWDNTKYGMLDLTYTIEDDVYLKTDSYVGTPAIGGQMVRRNSDPSFFISLNTPPEGRQEIEDLIGACVDHYTFTVDRGFRPSTADNPTFIDYETQMKAQISQIIVGDLPIDEWDSILDGWYAAGGEEYVKEMQDYIMSVEG